MNRYLLLDVQSALSGGHRPCVHYFDPDPHKFICENCKQPLHMSTNTLNDGIRRVKAAKLTSFRPHPPILSSLLKKAPNVVPSTDELEQLLSELSLAKEKALERSKKASDDLKTIRESIW